MNEAIQNMLTRRSCRNFDPSRVISDEDLELILQAGMYAPTGGGHQSPIMVVVQKPETIKKLSQMNANIIGNPARDPFYGATTVIVVLAEKGWISAVEDGALIMGNLMNAAHSLGIGSCWVHRAKEEFDSDEGKALLKEWGIKGEYRGVGHCVLGYALTPEKPAIPRKANYVTYVR
ncbi:MAG: nitroreductase family protein [Clostridia bacterium]|nr:nitroreductase family protein [Clostridia bacterium]